MKLCTAIVMVVLLAPRATSSLAPDRRPLGAVDFFGYKGLDLAAVRDALPFREGDSFPPAKVHSDQLKRQVAQAIERAIGREPTDVSFVCCDAKQNYMVYIGLPGESYEALAFGPVPTGGVRFPKDALKLGEDMDRAWTSAVMTGHATEDDSAGYSLTNDPKARKVQLALRDYALQHEELIRQVLTSSSDAQHRALAAQMMGTGANPTDRPATWSKPASTRMMAFAIMRYGRWRYWQPRSRTWLAAFHHSPSFGSCDLDPGWITTRPRWSSSRSRRRARRSCSRNFAPMLLNRSSRWPVGATSDTPKLP